VSELEFHGKSFHFTILNFIFQSENFLGARYLNFYKYLLTNQNMEKEMNCKDCKKKFKYIPHLRYPRKYCDKCSKERKKAWDERWKMKFEDGVD